MSEIPFSPSSPHRIARRAAPPPNPLRRLEVALVALMVAMPFLAVLQSHRGPVAPCEFTQVRVRAAFQECQVYERHGSPWWAAQAVAKCDAYAATKRRDALAEHCPENETPEQRARDVFKKLEHIWCEDGTFTPCPVGADRLKP